MPAVVEFDADHVHAELIEAGEHAAVGGLLDEYGVARSQEGAVDQVECLERARHHQDLLGVTRHRRPGPERLGQVLTQRKVALG